MSNGEVEQFAYTPTNWQDGITPVNAANLNKLEGGVQAAAAIADAAIPKPASPAANQGLVFDGTNWVAARDADSAAATASAANTDLAWTYGRTNRLFLNVTTVGGSIRTVAVPTYGANTRIGIRHGAASGTLTINHNAAAGTGAKFWLRSFADLVLAPAELIEFAYDTASGLWVEVSRDVGGGGGGATQYAIDFRNPNAAGVPGGAFPAVIAGTIWEEWAWHFIDSGWGMLYGIVRVPEDAVPTAPKLKIEFTGAAAGNAAIGADFARLVAGSSLNPAAFTQQFAATVTLAAGRLLTRQTWNITPANVVAGDLLIVRFYRDGANAADTMVGDFALLGGWLSLV